MKVVVTRLIRNRDTGENTEIIGEFHVEDVVCLYRNDDRVSVHFKDGTFMNVAHKLSEIRGLMNNPYAYERAY